jgi:hypothetical protein
MISSCAYLTYGDNGYFCQLLYCKGGMAHSLEVVLQPVCMFGLFL